MTDREEITALVIRLRMYFANGDPFIKSSWQQYDYATSVLNISYKRGQDLLSKNKRIKHLSKEDCIKELKSKSPEMYVVATADIIHDKYKSICKNLNIKDDIL